MFIKMCILSAACDDTEEELTMTCQEIVGTDPNRCFWDERVVKGCAFTCPVYGLVKGVYITVHSLR